MKQYNCPDCMVVEDSCDGCQRAASIPSNKIESPITDWWLKKDLWSDIPSCCRGCSNHPSNGGSGICHCTLPYLTTPIYYDVTTCTSTNFIVE